MSLLKGLNVKGRVLCNEPLYKHTTFKIGGPVKVWAGPEDLEDLKNLLDAAKTEDLPIFLIGEGSNILASDEPLNIFAIYLGRTFSGFTIDKNKIICGAGCRLQKFILNTIENSYSGLEFMAGIPGTIGGGLRMNAGGGLNGQWISEFVEGVKVMGYDGELRQLEKKDLKFGYRQSNLKDVIILEAEFRLAGFKDKSALMDRYKRFLEEKKNKQELSLPSAGCVFKNPAGSNFSAAELIEGCSFKGKGIGDAMVSMKHANFIVNLGKASFNDVIELIELIRDKVLNEYSISLETEIEILDNDKLQNPNDK